MRIFITKNFKHNNSGLGDAINTKCQLLESEGKEIIDIEIKNTVGDSYSDTKYGVIKYKENYKEEELTEI